MANFKIPQWFAKKFNLPSMEGQSITRTFSKLSRLYNADNIHIGMCFDYETGLNSRFQFEFNGRDITLTEENRNDQIWMGDLTTLEVEKPDVPGEFIQLSTLQNSQARVQAILNCLGNAFENAPGSDVSFGESDSYLLMTGIDTYVPGSSEVRSKYTDGALIEAIANNANFDGTINGTKTIVCIDGSRIIQTLTGNARILMDRSCRPGSLWDWINKKVEDPTQSVDPEVAALIEDFTNDSYLISVVNRKNDGQIPGGTIGRINFQDPDPDPDQDLTSKRRYIAMNRVGGKPIRRLGDDSDSDIAEIFKSIYEHAVEYQPLAGSGDPSGIPGYQGLDYVHIGATSPFTGKGTEAKPLNISKATTSSVGVVSADGVTISVSPTGVLSAIGAGGTSALLEVQEPIITTSTIEVKYKGNVEGVKGYVWVPDSIQEISFDGDYDPIADITTFEYDVFGNQGFVTEVKVSMRIETATLKVYRSTDRKLPSTLGVIELDGEVSISKVPGELFIHTEESLIPGIGIGELVTATSNNNKTNLLVQVNDITKRTATEISDDGSSTVEKIYYDYSLFVVSGETKQINGYVTFVDTYKFEGNDKPRLGDRVKIVDAILEGTKTEPDNALIRVSVKYTNPSDSTDITYVDYLCLTEKTEDEYYGRVISIDRGGNATGGGDFSDLDARLKRFEDAITIS